MKRTVSAGEAGARFGELMDGVFYRHDELVIEQDGKPMAVVIPAYLYEVIERGRGQIAGLMQKERERNKDAAPLIFEQQLVEQESPAPTILAPTAAFLGQDVMEQEGADVADEAAGKAEEQASTAESASLPT
jgi:prevent-host-death family protein